MNDRHVVKRRPNWAGIFRTAVNPLRYAIPASRKPGVAIHGHPRDACAAPMEAAGKTSLFLRSGKYPPNPSFLELYQVSLSKYFPRPRAPA